MGTDVYLTWDKMTKKEEKDQMTGFSISSGDKGYLRASISMTNENALLRSVFPDNWEEEKEYDFKNPKNMMRLELGARLYLLSALKGEQVIHRDMKQNHEFGEMIRKMVKEAIGEKGGTIQGSGMASIGDIRSSVMWLNSLFNFYILGLEKQKKGLKPKICISW